MNYTCEKIQKLNVVTHTQTICGKEVKYTLFKLDETEYEISVWRDGIEESAKFFCDFFTVVDLLKVMENTDTLPENIKEIAEDFACL